jgi:hypothetical protein
VPTHYRLERQSGSGWITLAVVPVPSYSYADLSVVANTSYVYRVRATDDSPGGNPSAPSPADLATTIIFSQLTAQTTTVSLEHFTQLLKAVNAVRAANGDPALQWTTSGFLQGAVPPPAVGELVYGEHVLALRRAMNAALGALGLPQPTYTDPNLPGTPAVAIRAIHLTELQQVTQ